LDERVARIVDGTSVHLGESSASIRERTGFDYDEAQPVVTTPAPDAATLALIRGPIAIAEVYPDFTARVFPHACAA
jgi:glutaconate CoA-transferase subunit B